MMYEESNIVELLKIAENGELPKYKSFYFKKLKKELQVHTKGRLFEKIYELFPNEDPEATSHVINAYEPITMGSIWKGINNISRIIGNTAFNVTASERISQELEETKYYQNYAQQWIDISVSSDPNAVAVWVEMNGKWEFRFIETCLIKSMNDEHIIFIDLDESEYEIVLSQHNSRVSKLSASNNHSKQVIESYTRDEEYVFTTKAYIYISKNQFIRFKRVGNDNTKLEFSEVKMKHELKVRPYSYTGTSKIVEGVFNTPVSPFIPFGNIALLQHRAFTNIERLFGYPRMSEVELPCDAPNCVSGLVPCAKTDENPKGLEDCGACKGTGRKSTQSIFKVYKRQIDPNNPGFNEKAPPVEFITPDTEILKYNKDSYKESLASAEESVYVQQRQQTGNVESWKTRELALTEMYAWIIRNANQFYINLEHHLTIRDQIEGNYDMVTVEKPMSYAVINELEAFEILDVILKSDSPQFIKHSQIEAFLGKYISKGNNIHKIVDVLMMVDPFAFYTTKDIDTLSGQNDILEADRFTHAYAFPLLIQMAISDRELLSNETSLVAEKLRKEIDTRRPKSDLQKNILDSIK